MNINLDIVLYLCGAIATVAAAAAIISRVVNNTIKKVAKESIEQYMTDYNKQVTDKINSLTKLLEDHIQNSDSNNECIRDTLLSQARLEINQVYSCYVDKGSIDSYTLSSLISLYKAYKKLGGNSFVESEINYLRKLKIINRVINEEDNND